MYIWEKEGVRKMYKITHFSLYQSRCIEAGRGPHFLGKTKKVSFLEEDSCLSQVDPRAVAFALGNLAVLP